MPKVSPEHLEGRRRAILAAAVSCFAREGIQNTTMQDVFAESGISPGGVYRYFPSKEQLVLAIAEGVAGQLDDFARARAERAEDAQLSLQAEVEDLIRFFDTIEESEAHRRVAIAIWSESLRNAEVARVISRAIQSLTDSVSTRVSRMIELEALPPTTDARGTAQVLVAILPGYLLQRVWFPQVNVTQFVLAAQSLVAARG